VPAIPKKTEKTKRADHVEVDFRSPPGEILHFNQYTVEGSGGFLQISLWFSDSFGVAIPVFRGLISKADLKEPIEGLKRYIEKIGQDSKVEYRSGRPPMWNSPPVSFNAIDCVSRNDCSEIVVRNFSHKSVMEAAAKSTPVIGATHGVYVSAGSVHRQLVIDLIKESSDHR
jgi:hypothetical protein